MCINVRKFAVFFKNNLVIDALLIDIFVLVSRNKIPIIHIAMTKLTKHCFQRQRSSISRKTILP